MVAQSPRARKGRTEREGGEGARGVIYLKYRGTTRGRMGYDPLPYNHLQIYYEDHGLPSESQK